MKEKIWTDKVMSIVERMGVFQINKFAWRDEKVKKILKKMVKMESLRNITPLLLL